MKESRAARRFADRPALVSSLIVVATIVIAHLTYLARLRSNNALLYYSGLGNRDRGWWPGGYTLDPNEGWTAQALGKLAAQSWVHGDIPLWNVYEGLGQPLAGEMQSAAFFLPFILLQLLPNGLFVMHLALEIVAGLSMLALLRQLRLGLVPAVAGAIAFGLNGVFSIMTNAPFNPIAFMPMSILGVEMMFRALSQKKSPRWAVAVIALALAWSLYSGFPETAFLQGLVMGAWALLRVWQTPTARTRFLGFLALAGGAGLALAAPILLAFATFMSFGTTAYHEGIANAASYQPLQATAFGLPFLAGGALNPVIGLQAGYATVSVLLLAVVGLFGRRDRGLRILLGVVAVLFLLNAYGFAPVKFVLNHTPGIAATLGYKYGLVLIVFAAIILMAFAIDDLLREQLSRRAISVAAAVIGLYAAGSLLAVAGSGHLTRLGWTVAVCVILIVTLVLIVMALWRSAGGARMAASSAVLVTVLVGAETVWHYAMPQLSSSPTGPIDTAPITFLQQNLGTSRFYTLGPIQPNYGTYWGLSQLNANDLPIAKKYSDYLVHNLTPAKGTPGAVGTQKSFNSFQLVPFNPKPAQQRVLLTAYGQQQRYFRDAAVKYVVMSPGVGDAAGAQKLGLHKVFTSKRAEIWEDPQASPNYTTPDGACQITRQTVTSVALDCAAPTTLTRRQLSSPGWSATINGRTTAMSDAPDQLFQKLEVPQGKSEISFAYQPKGFTLSLAISLLAAIGLLTWLGAAHLRRFRGEGRG